MIERILTVVTPAATQALTTISSVKSELNISGTTYDTLLQGYVDAASINLSFLCNRVFPSEVLSERLFLNTHHDSITLSRSPITSISSVTVDGEVLDSSAYKFDSESGILFRLAEYSITGGNVMTRWDAAEIVVAYTAGYSTIPAAIADACVQTVCNRWYARARDPSVRSEEITGVGRQEFWVGQLPNGVSPSTQSAIQAYRKQPIQ